MPYPAIVVTECPQLEKLERLSSGPNWKSLYESQQAQHCKEREMWERKTGELETELQLVGDTAHEAEQKQHIITDLSHQLQDSETRINQLLTRTDSLEKDNAAIKTGYDQEISRLKENIRELEEYIDKTDSEKNSMENSKDSEIMRLRKELSEKACYKEELKEMKEKLLDSATEVETLTSELLDMKDTSDWEGGQTQSDPAAPGPPARLARLDSLAELRVDAVDPAGLERGQLVTAHQDLASRLSLACTEIRTLKTSVKTAQDAADEMELVNIRLNQSLSKADARHTEQIKMFSTKIEDLTTKYLAAEKQARTLKLKCYEGKSRRRSSTGLRPEEILVNKEAEHVLEDIEINLLNIEGIVKGKESVTKEGRKKSYETSTKASRARRKSSESSELSFVDRLKKTDKSITDLNRKLSLQAENSGAAGQLENVRRQLLGTVSKWRTEADAGPGDLERLLVTLEQLAEPGSALHAGLEPALPSSEDISSHLDTVMAFLFKAVEDVFEARRESQTAEVVTDAVVSLYSIGSAASGGAELSRALAVHNGSLQVYLLLDLQYQLSALETRLCGSVMDPVNATAECRAATRQALVRLLQAKQFLPHSLHTSRKLQQLTELGLQSANLQAVFLRLQAEAESVFSRLAGLTTSLVSVLTDAISCQLSDKLSIVESVRSEALNLIEVNFFTTLLIFKSTI